jgi:hypothetical protein
LLVNRPLGSGIATPSAGWLYLADSHRRGSFEQILVRRPCHSTFLVAYEGLSHLASRSPVNDAVWSELCSVLSRWPVVGRFTVKLQQKNRSMPGDVITIVILFVFVDTVRSDHIKGSVSAECLEKIA